MSLIRAMLRLAAVEALLVQPFPSYAQGRITDRSNEPLLDVLSPEAEDKGMPFVTVYTDRDDNMRNTVEHGMYSGTRACTLTFEMGTASAIDDKEGNRRIVIPRTDRGMELGIDFLEQQVKDAVFGDSRSPWVQITKPLRMKTWDSRSSRS